MKDIKVRTLLTYLPDNSIFLSTSLLGRCVFLIIISFLILSTMRKQPYNILPNLFSFGIYVICFILAGAKNVLLQKRTFMLFLACLLISVINTFLAPDRGNISFSQQAEFGFTRGSTFLSLALSTIFIATITRPSDLSRFLSIFKLKPHLIAITSIPLAIFGILIYTYNDLIIAAQAKKISHNKNRSFKDFIVDISVGLLAISLNRSLYLYHIIYSHKNLSINTEYNKLLGNYSLLSKYDILFVLLLIPLLILTAIK